MTDPCLAPAGRAAARRAAILEAASALFLERGYASTSLDAIIARAGGSKATLYAQFDGKEGLFAAVVDSIVGQEVSPIPPPGADSLDVRACLETVARTHLDMVLSDRHIALVRLVAGEAGRFPELGALYHRHGPGDGHTKLAALMHELVARGELALSDVGTATSDFWGMLLHEWTLARLYGVRAAPTRKQVRALAASVVGRFLAAYGCSSTGAAGRSSTPTRCR